MSVASKKSKKVVVAQPKLDNVCVADKVADIGKKVLDVKFKCTEAGLKPFVIGQTAVLRANLQSFLSSGVTPVKDSTGGLSMTFIPGSVFAIDCGVVIDMPDTHCAYVTNHESVARLGLVMANGGAVVGNGDRVTVYLANVGKHTIYVRHGSDIAHLGFMPSHELRILN